MLRRLFSSFSAQKSFAVFVVVILTLSSSHACFIRNCPKGGKRSMDPAVVPNRECMRCGQDGTGQCVGRSICCSPQGCLIGTAEAKKCEEENRSTTPCFVPGQACGEGGQGKCVADNVCCDSESCAINERCRLKTPLADNLGSGDNLVELIQKLLRVKDYD